MKNYQKCDRISITALSLAVFLGVMAFMPTGLIPSPVLKGFLVLSLMLVAFIAWLIGRLIEGAFHIPWTAVLASSGCLVVVMFLSALFSQTPHLAFLGEGFEAGTFAVFGSMLLGLFLASVLFTSSRRVMLFLKTFFMLYGVLAVFQIVHLIFPNATALGVFYNRVDSPVGLWSDFSFLSGAVAIASMLMLELSKTTKKTKILLGVNLAFSLFFVVLTNILTVWILVGLSSVIVLVYTLILHRASESRYFPFLAFFLSLVGLLFILANSLFGGMLAGLLGASYVDIHPTFSATAHTSIQSLQHHPIVGAGPNRFLREWLSFRPTAVNLDPLWDAPFTSGSSFLMTLAVLGGGPGIIATLVFLFSYLYEAGRKLFGPSIAEHRENMPIFGLFILSLYFMLSLVVASPGIPVIVCALVFAGILIGTLVANGRIPMRNILFLREQRTSFFSILLIVALLLVSASGVYGAVQRFGGTVIFERSLRAAAKGDIDLANARIGSAISLADLPTFERTRVLYAASAIQTTVGSTSSTASSDGVRTALQNAISTGNTAALNAIALDPTDPASYLARGDLLRLIAPLKIEGVTDVAVEAYQRAIELVPHYPKSYLSLAELYFDVGDNANARIYIDKALAEKKNYTEAYFLLAQIEIAAGNTNTAISRIQDATVIDPNNPDAYFELGVLRFNTGDYNNAIEAFQRTVSLNNQYFNAWYYLALGYQKVGNQTDATKILSALHTRFPDNQNINKALNLGNPSSEIIPAPTEPSIAPSPVPTKTEKSKKLPLPSSASDRN